MSGKADRQRNLRSAVPIDLRTCHRTSGRKALAAPGAARRDDPAPADGGHPGPEAVTTLAHDLAGLKRPLHWSCSTNCNRGHQRSTAWTDDPRFRHRIVAVRNGRGQTRPGPLASADRLGNGALIGRRSAPSQCRERAGGESGTAPGPTVALDHPRSKPSRHEGRSVSVKSSPLNSNGAFMLLAKAYTAQSQKLRRALEWMPFP